MSGDDPLDSSLLSVDREEERELARRLEDLNRELAQDGRAVTVIPLPLLTAGVGSARSLTEQQAPDIADSLLQEWGDVLAAWDTVLRKRPKRIGSGVDLCPTCNTTWPHPH